MTAVMWRRHPELLGIPLGSAAALVGWFSGFRTATVIVFVVTGLAMWLAST